jgi:hypothetical protein
VTELVFECLDAQPERYAASPILRMELQIAEVSGEQVHAIALRCQIRIEPQRRRYDPEEAEGLLDLFGEPERWGDTLKPLQFANVAQMVPGFTGSVRVDLPVPCTYDLEVAATRYFEALRGGEIPLLLLFSGTVFTKRDGGFAVTQVPWHKECNYRLPVAIWRELMDQHFPNSAWLRLHRDTLDALLRFKSHEALPTWDHVVEALLGRVGEGRP